MEVEIHPKVLKFISSIQDGRARESAIRRFSDIERYGIVNLRKAGVSELIHPRKGISLDEIRVKGKRMEYRYFGMSLNNNVYGIMHGYIKKENKLRKQEIETAIGRMAHWTLNKQ